MPHSYPADYAGPILKGDNHWIVHKFCGHHSWHLAEYHIRIMTFDGKTEFVCTCQAGRNCKHIHMVADTLKPKKDLF
jgi:hypothetical protein